MNLNGHDEPVRLASAVNAALVATVNVLALILAWSVEVTAGLNLAVGAWTVVIAVVVRSRVSPVRESDRG